MFLEGISGAVRLVSIEGGNSDEYRAHAANIWSKEELAVKSNTVFAAFHRRMPCTFSAAEKKVRMKAKPTSTEILKTSFLPRNKAHTI